MERKEEILSTDADRKEELGEWDSYLLFASIFLVKWIKV